MVAVGHDELSERPEVGLDRIGPRRIRGGEHQLDPIRLAPFTDRLAPVMVQVVQDHMNPLTVIETSPDRLQCPQGRFPSFAAFDPAEQLVLTDRVAGKELSGSVRFVVVRPQPLGSPLGCPPRATDRFDGQGLRTRRTRTCGLWRVPGTTPIRASFCSFNGSRRLFPGLGPLERDPLSSQDLTETFTTDPHPATGLGGQIVDQFPDRPASEWAPQLLGASLGRLDDQLAVSRRDQAGTATPAH